MESKEHTPAIVVTEIGDCISTWNEVLLGIAPGRLLVSPPCWLA